MTYAQTPVERALRGESFSSIAKSLGKPTTSISRIVKNHPDYVKAVAEGRVKPPQTKGGDPHQNADTPELRQAVEAVVNGELVTTVAARYGIPRSTLTKYLKRWHPDIVLRGANADPQRNAKAAIARAEGILKRAQERLA